MINPQKETKKILLLILGSLLIFFLGFNLGKFSEAYFSSSSKGINFINKDYSGEEKVDFNIFWQAWDKVSDNYLYLSDINPQDLVYGAVKGMVSSLGDPYTAFFNPEEFTELKESMASQYEGIGIEMGFENNQVVVITPFKSSPAEKAGIKAGDYILKIADENTTGMSLSEVGIKIRGEKGTNINLTLLSKQTGQEYEVDIQRDIIIYDTVTLEFKNDTAYLRILHFGDNTNSKWNTAVEKILDSSVSSIILDLRNNSGGYVDSASYIAGDFIGNKVAVKQRFSDGSIVSLKSSNSKARLKNYDLVIVVNEGSASATEILAGALKDYKFGTLIGEKTFGKGIVQDQISFMEGSGIHVTTSEWLTPNGDSVHKKGIEPDIKVPITEDQIKEGHDPQLDKALEILSDNR